MEALTETEVGTNGVAEATFAGPSIIEKQVHLRRKEPKSHFPPEVVAKMRKKLGAIWVNRGPLRGLTNEQERKYLPILAGIDEDSREWAKLTREFWNEFFIDVPADGVALDISTVNGEPRNLRDWVSYQWAIKHKLVARSEDEVRTSLIKKFYIYDPDEADRKKSEKVAARRRAYTEFIKLTTPEAGGNNVHKMNWVFRILTGVNPARMNTMQVENQLEEIVQRDPDKFYSAITDKDLEIRATIQEMIGLNIIRRIGNHVFFNDNKLGETMEEAIEFCKSPRNSETVSILSAQLKERRENPTAVLS